MLNKQTFTIIASPIRRDIYNRLKQQYPKYGDISKLMRWLVQQVVEGRIKPSLPQS